MIVKSLKSRIRNEFEISAAEVGAPGPAPARRSSASRRCGPRPGAARRRCCRTSCASSRRTSTARSSTTGTSSSMCDAIGTPMKKDIPPQPARRRPRPGGDRRASSCSRRTTRSSAASRSPTSRCRRTCGPRASTSPCLGGEEEREKAAEALDRAAGLPAPRGRAALRAALRAGAPLLRPTARSSAARASRSCCARSCRRRDPEDRIRRRRGRREAGPDPVTRGFLFLLDKPAGLTSHDVVERVRKATGRRPHRPQRDARSDGDGAPAALRRAARRGSRASSR